MPQQSTVIVLVTADPPFLHVPVDHLHAHRRVTSEGLSRAQASLPVIRSRFAKRVTGMTALPCALTQYVIFLDHWIKCDAFLLQIRDLAQI